VTDAVLRDLAEQLGLRDDELEMIQATLGRDPNRTELAMYAAMWLADPLGLGCSGDASLAGT
jgi:phosphoribosylformylglycinamidine (FGAM) synthase-like enzyme